MDDQKLQVLRSVDKFDKIGPVGVYDCLTTGRMDPSGDFTPGCGLNNGQAVTLVYFLLAGKRDSPLKGRLDLMCALEETETSPGRTAWDDLIDMPTCADNTWANGCRPSNIGWALDDMLKSAASLTAKAA